MMYFTLPRRLAAEALGSALLLAVVIGSGIMGDRLSGGNVAIALLGNTLATGAGLVVLHETVSTRESSGGKFISIKLSFRAESREQYEVAHAVLREHPEVKWTI